ncbi:MAG TPA: EcsC family protein [Bacillus sp. (in: firmicutes)]|uniref:EcsC family protein n=1 Tax=Bacillus litorisediminis TaxID=2922713 RepID=UPI001FAC9B0D|nr:EcsC family protein [Bacillus litorisediminis]HWO75480.1 EcsC family protein [Bacillus sp. (in: firmicutes)]
MEHSKFHQTAWENVLQWEKNLVEYQGNDFERTYERWLNQAFEALPDYWKDPITQSIDQWIFHIYALFHETSIQNEAKERILSTAKAFNDEIQNFEDLKNLPLSQLNYIADREQSKHRIYSIIQGGLVGTGRTIFSSISIPVTLINNIRVVQLMSYIYGYDLSSPYELMTSLKVFHAATLPKRYQGEAWLSLKNDLLQKEKNSSYFYDGEEQIISKEWIEFGMDELIKLVAIQLFQPKKDGRFPLLSVVMGVQFQYSLSKRVASFAHHYYMYRYLLQHKNKVEKP